MTIKFSPEALAKAREFCEKYSTEDLLRMKAQCQQILGNPELQDIAVKSLKKKLSPASKQNIRPATFKTYEMIVNVLEDRAQTQVTLL